MAQPIDPASDGHARGRRRRGPLVISVAAAAIGLGALSAAWGTGGGAGVWTDGRTVRIPANDAAPRRVLWAPAERVAGTVNTEVDEYEPRVSIDGTTMVLVRGRPGANADLLVARRTARGWTEPTPIAEVNTDADELGPELSADGTMLWFYSDRAGGVGGHDLWTATAVDGAWSTPVNAGPALNTPFNEYGPALTPDGATLYFSSDRPRPGDPGPAASPAPWTATLRERRSRRDYDLYAAAVRDGGWGEPTALADVNTADDEGAPAVSPAGDFLYFASDRPGGAGGFDLYRVRIGDGAPRTVERLDAAINTASNELDPTLGADGFRIVFSSARRGGDEDLWTSVSREVYIERDGAPSIAATLRDGWRRWWPWLLLLGLVAALLAMLVAGWRLWRSGGWRRRFLALGLLAQCLLVSLIAHALIAMGLAAWTVREGIGELLRGATGTRVVLASAGELADDGIADTLRDQLDERAAPPPPPAVDLGALSSIGGRAEAPRHVVESAPPVDATGLDRIVATMIDTRRAAPPPGATATAGEVGGATPAAPAPRAASIEATLATAPADDVAVAPIRSASVGAASIVAAVASRPVAMHAALDRRPAPMPPVADAPMDDVAQPPSMAPRSSIGEATVDAAVPFDDLPPSGQLVAGAHVIEPGSPPVATTDAALRAFMAFMDTPRRSVPELAGAAIDDAPRPVSVPGAAVAASVGAPAGDDAVAQLVRSSVADAVEPDLLAEHGRRHAAATPLPAALLDPARHLVATSPGVRPIDALGVLDVLDRGDRPPMFDEATGVDSVDVLAIPPTPAEPSAPQPPSAAPVPAESFGQRAPERRDEMLERMGGGSDTEAAVGRALEWFARHRSADGHWSARRPMEGDGGAAPCDCGNPAEVDMDVASTSLVLLCFLAAGHTHTAPGPYRELVDQGIQWLMARQAPDGDLRRAPSAARARRADGKVADDTAPDTMYGQTIAAVALCEASAMTRDAAVSDAARRAVGLVVARASRSGSSADDTSVLGWQVMAIESARRAGVASADGAMLETMRGARAWLDGVGRGGRYGYRRGGSPSIAMTAEAMFVRQLVDQFVGASPDGARMRESAAFVLEAMPSWSDGAPTHHWYYATLALFQHQAIDASAWARWNEALKPELLSHQRRDGHAAGSWDPHDEWSRLGGRIYQTAVCTLSLEVYYRYRASPGDERSETGDRASSRR